MRHHNLLTSAELVFGAISQGRLSNAHAKPAGSLAPLGWTKVDEIVGANELATANADQTVNYGTTLQEGDVAVFFATSDSTAFPTGGTYMQTAGYTTILTENANATSMAHEIKVKRMGATPDTSFTVRTAGSLDVCYGMQVFRGQDPNTFLDGPIATQPGFSGNVSAPALETFFNGSLEFIVCFINEVDPGSATSWDPNGPPPSAPTGFSNFMLLDANNAQASNAMAVIASRVVDAGTQDAVDFAGPDPVGGANMGKYRFALKNAVG